LNRKQFKGVLVNCVVCLYRCTVHVEFPSEPEESYDPKLYESTAYMLEKSAKKEMTATEQADDEVKLNSKKRKAITAPDKKEKVHMYTPTIAIS